MSLCLHAAVFSAKFFARESRNCGGGALASDLVGMPSRYAPRVQPYTWD